MTDMLPSTPLLVVETIAADPERSKCMVAVVRVGGYQLRVVLDFSLRERLGIEYVEMPKLLAMHRPSQQAVIQLMARAFDGEQILTPVDLTEQIHQATPRSPFEPLPEQERVALRAIADKVNVEILDFEGAGDEPCRFSATLRMHDRVFGLTGEIYAGAGRKAALSWRKGPDPESFSRAELYAIERALADRCEMLKSSEQPS